MGVLGERPRLGLTRDISYFLPKIQKEWKALILVRLGFQRGFYSVENYVDIIDSRVVLMGPLSRHRDGQSRSCNYAFRIRSTCTLMGNCFTADESICRFILPACPSSANRGTRYWRKMLEDESSYGGTPSQRQALI